MAEMLIVVAIIGVLAAVAFIAVNQHQRSLERLERDSVAREIFIAAQNHLTMAESQGYLGVSDNKGKEEDAAKGYYFFVYPEDKYSADGTPKTLLDLMLPFGSIDETVRGGGSYIIRYHPDTATVMDVFYCSNPSTDRRYGYDLSGTTKQTLTELLNTYGSDSAASARRNFNDKVLGWYGGATAETLSRAEVYAPIIVVENGDKLRIGIKEGKGPNGETNPAESSLQVIVKGVTSGAEKAFTLRPNKALTLDSRATKPGGDIEGVTCDYAIILDDITTEKLHFADLVADMGSFIPGEDVKIQAIAFDNTQISNIGYSAEITVNSLYQSLQVGVADTKGNIPMTASIGSIRHLENLDKDVSNVADKRQEKTNTYLLNNAVQTSDLSWKDFKTNTNAATTGIVLYSSGTGPTPAKATGAGNYYPVEPTNALTYDGKNHSVSGIVVSFDGTNGAGMFGTIPNNEDNPPAVSNLALIDFTIAQTGSGNAGALAGTLTNCTVNNVLAYNSTKAAAVNITATSGNAGGLIGSATKCTIQKSAAAVIVKSTSGNAGGLIGSTTQGTVTACYSGGHTSDAAYSKTDYNVTAGDNAGGLIGSVDSTPIDYCYSTCSATGAKVGGLVGTCAGTIKRSYCAGLVKSTAATPVEGAFAGTWTGMTKDDDNHYLAIINEWEVKDASDNITGYKDMNPVSGSETVVGLAAIDETVATFNDFCAPKDSEGNDLWKPAVPYDAKLIEYYGGKYNLKTVERLGATLKTGDTDTTEYFVATHYGDWPAPEIFVVNTKGTNATPATPTP